MKLAQNYGMQHVIGKLRLSLGEVKTPDNRPADEVRQAAMQARFVAWNNEETAKAADWKIVRPATMKSTMPYLNLQAGWLDFSGRRHHQKRSLRFAI